MLCHQFLAIFELLVFLTSSELLSLAGDLQAGSFQGGEGVVDRRLLADDYGRCAVYWNISAVGCHLLKIVVVLVVTIGDSFCC